ncbi:MAG TPA: hypothetical protein VFG92_06085 [Agromyces sp.]|nr:hypothetical protein [Agromyces sp.]
MTDAAGSDAARPDAAGPDASTRAAIARARELLADAVTTLRASGARDETLAEYVAERRVLGLPRAARMAPATRVWRLGVLLLAADGRLFATGRVVRAERAVRRSVIAESVAEQRAYRAAAVKGGIAEGSTVNFDARPIDLDELGRTAASGPLLLRDGGVLVRWNPSQPDMLTPLDRYLADRVELLAAPPSGA